MDAHRSAAALVDGRREPPSPHLLQSIGRPVLFLLLCCLAQQPAAMAQQAGEGVSERVITRTKRDVNGKDSVNEKVVTRTSRTDDREDVWIEIYLPSMQADRLALHRRIHRVTTPNAEGGSQTVEVCEERPLGSQSEPLRVVERAVTTVRKTGPDSYISERRESDLDLNGRLVPVVTDVATAAAQ